VDHTVCGLLANGFVLEADEGHNAWHSLPMFGKKGTPIPPNKSSKGSSVVKGAALSTGGSSRRFRQLRLADSPSL